MKVIEIPETPIVIEMTPEGKDGHDGVSVVSFELVSVVDLVKTYRFTLSNGDHFDFSVSDGETGNGIASVSKISSVGLVDTYRIVMTDGSYYDYTVTNGKDGKDGASEWGAITGDIRDQTDLAEALDSKADSDDVYTKSDVYTKTETDTLLSDKANSDDVYTKTETDNLLADKADSDDVYTKTEVDDEIADLETEIASKADSSSVYTKSETDTLLSSKADTGTSYTKAETNTLLNGKANVGDSYTKAEDDALLAEKADADTVYTKAETDAMMINKAAVITETATADLVTITDGANAPVTALSVGIDPVQDLHGFDHPWVGGGGKNLLNPNIYSMIDKNSVKTTVKSDNVINFTGTASAGTYFILNATQSVADYTQAPFTLPAGTYTYSVRKADGTKVNFGGSMALYYWLSSDTSTRQQVTANTNTYTSVTLTIAEEAYVAPSVYITGNTATGIDVYFQLESGSTATTWSPYENICPISGFDSAKVTRTGVNTGKLSESNEGNGQRRTVTYSDSGATVTATGTYGRQGWLIPVVKGQTYTISFNGIADNATGSGYQSRCYIADRDAVWGPTAEGYIRAFQIPTTAEVFTYSFVAPSNVLFFGMYVSTTATDGSMTVSGFQLELGNSATSYEAPSIQTVTIPFGDTVYGGTLDVLTGMLTVDKAVFTLPETTTINSASQFTTKYVNFSIPEHSNQAVLPICDRTKCVAYSQRGQPYNLYVSSTNDMLLQSWVPTDATLADVNAVLEGATVCYALATPITVTLTGEQMETLLGYNAIWADTGDTTVEYRADTKTYIDTAIAKSQYATRSLITGIESAMVATQNYTSGALIIVGDDLYKATANIASGGALTVDTNVSKITLAQYILEQLSA